VNTVRDMAIWYLRNVSDGENRVRDFQKYTTLGQRDGQAFMNCLPREDYLKLTGSLVDPFYRDGNIPVAIDFLTKP
jgi:hypothetical protein